MAFVSLLWRARLSAKGTDNKSLGGIVGLAEGFFRWESLRTLQSGGHICNCA
jgi:hypothetical protein